MLAYNDDTMFALNMSANNGKTRTRSKSTVRKVRKSSVTRRLSRRVIRTEEESSQAMREEATPYRVISRALVGKQFTSVDLFCGAGGITEGFRRAGFLCHYANDINHWAIETFRANHPTTHADNRPIEQVDAAALRRELNLERGELDVIVGGPPCQGFSINAPERFLEDPRNSLFKHYLRFLDEFEGLSPNSNSIRNLTPTPA